MERFRLSRPAPAAAVLLGVLLLCGRAPARDDDIDFALALAERGYDDLAAAEVDRLPKGEKADYAKCQLTRRSALTAANKENVPPQEVRAKFDATRKAFDTFLKAYPGSKRVAEAEFTMGNLMTAFAYYLTKNLDKFEVKERPGVQDEAGKIFDDAIRYLTSIKEREQKKDEALPPDDPDKFEKRNQAWYYLCLAMHDRAMLKPPGDAVRLQQFTQEIEEARLYLEETDGQYFGLHASNLMGMGYWHRGQMQKGWSAEDIKSAREFFTGAFTPADSPNVEQEAPGWVEVMFLTAGNYGAMCNEVGTLDGVSYPKLFHDEIVRMAEKLPTMKTRASGLQVLIEDAKAMAACGKAEGAIAQLNQISEWAKSDPSWGRGVDQMAKSALNDVLASIPTDSNIQLSATVLFKAAEGSYREQNWSRAIRAYQRVLTAIDAVPEPEKRKAMAEDLGIQCWDRMYECYGRMERNLEAYFAADFPVQRFLASGQKVPTKDMAGLALSRVYALQKLIARAPKDQKADLQDQLRKAQELYTTRFQDFAEGIGSQSYTVASQKLKDGNAAVRSGDTTRGDTLFKEAIEQFGKVDSKDSLFGLAQVRIGEVMVTQGRSEDAIKYLQGLIQKNMADWTNSATPPGQKQPWGWALYWMANAYGELKQYPRVIETLDGFEAKFQGASLDNFVPLVRYLRISSLIKNNRGDDAVRECDQLLKDTPDNYNSVKAALEVANDLKVRSDRAEKDKNEKLDIELKKRSLPYFDFWLSRADEVNADQLTFVGSLHNEVKSYARAAELWTKALDIFKRQGNEKMVLSLTLNLAGLLVGQERYAEALPQFEALFIKTPEVSDLRDVYAALRRRPANVAAPVWDKKVKDLVERIGEVLAKDPDAAARAGEAKKVAAGGDAEVLVRAYADTPELRRALARATALCVLGNDAALPPELKTAAFQLVMRAPELLSNIARCYEELATANAENAIRSVNIYGLLIESSPDADDPENPSPGNKYSLRWFDWKYHYVKVYLTTGTAYKERGEAWLRTVCDVVRAMSNIGEIARANKERTDLGKQFEELRDKADQALRGIGKDGCK